MVTSVESVENRVSASDSSPELAVLAAARAALSASPYRAVRGVQCTLDRDRLRLQGRLGSYFHKQLAQETVAHLPGVTGVINAVEVDW